MALPPAVRCKNQSAGEDEAHAEIATMIGASICQPELAKFVAMKDATNAKFGARAHHDPEQLTKRR